MNEDLNSKAKEIIEKIWYITIATISKDGLPWNSPVYCAHDKNYNFYWASWKKNQHSKNIKENNKVFIVIYDSTVAEGKGRGVYIKAKAYELNDKKDITHALSYLYGRKNKAPRSALEFMGKYPRRVYKVVPEKVWINIDGEVNGNYVDKRVEVNLS